MPLFNRFPYTNFHELNLNWILEQIPILKKYRDETEELHDDTKVLHDDTQVLHDNTKVLHDNVVKQHKEITAEITQGKKDISDLTTTGKHEISDLTDASKHAITDLTNSGKIELNSIITTGTNQLDTLIDTGKADIKNLTDTGKTTIDTATTTGKAEISDLTDESKQAITSLTNSGKIELNTIITNGTNQLGALIDAGKSDIKTLTDSGKATIDTATSTGKAEITNTVTDGKAQITTSKDVALDAIGTAKDSATTTIKNLESSAASAITAKGDLYLHQIADEGKKQTDAVTAEGTTQITNITQLGDTYKTEMTTLKNDAQTSTDNAKASADNAKASETKAKEYAETAKTLKPLYWGGDLENLHQTLDVKAECENAVNKESTTRWCNLLILKNATNSPDSTKEWQCKITTVNSAKANLLAWNSDGSMYVGSYDASATDITWVNTVNLDEITKDITDVEKKAWTLNETRTPLLDDTNLTITDVFEQKLSSFYISGNSKYKVTTLNKFMNKSVVHGNAKIYVAYITNDVALWFCPECNAYANVSKSSPTIIWYFTRTLNIAEWTYKIKNPTMKVGADDLAFTNRCAYNPNSCEYRINVSFQGVDAPNKMYKIILDSELEFLKRTGDMPSYIVASEGPNRTLIPVIITHSPNNKLELWVTISETDKASIVGKSCFLSFTLW